MTKEEFLDKCISFSMKINKLRKYLREEQHEYNNSDQIQRCGTSIGANYSEACDAESRADFIHKLTIAQKEAHETFPCASHCSGHAFAVTATLPALTAMPLLSTSATTSVDPLAATMSALPSHSLQSEQSSPIAGTATSTLYL